MVRRINPSRIKKNLTYSILEAAEELGNSTATIRNWIKQGLPIQKDQRPFLIFGSDLRGFIIRRRKARRFTLQDGELNCFSCKAGRLPLNGSVVYFPHTAKTGRLSGVCSVCGNKCARFIGKAQISAFSKIMQIQFNDGRAP